MKKKPKELFIQNKKLDVNRLVRKREKKLSSIREHIHKVGLNDMFRSKRKDFFKSAKEWEFLKDISGLTNKSLNCVETSLNDFSRNYTS